MLAVPGGGGFCALCVAVLPDVLVLAAGVEDELWQAGRLSAAAARVSASRAGNLMGSFMKR